MSRNEQRKKLKAKKANKPMPELSVRPSADERRRATQLSHHEDPRKPVLAARARHMGAEDTVESRLQHTAPWLGDDVGRCLARLAGSEVADLWKVWCGFCASRANYRRRILGMSDFATMNIQMTPEKFETDQSHTVDLRSEEQRDEDAKNAYARWNSYVGAISSLEYQSLIHAAEKGHVEVWADAGPTARGYGLVSALRELSEQVK